jgi:hypothetical protein
VKENFERMNPFQRNVPSFRKAGDDLAEDAKKKNPPELPMRKPKVQRAQSEKQRKSNDNSLRTSISKMPPPAQIQSSNGKPLNQQKNTILKASSERTLPTPRKSVKSREPSIVEASIDLERIDERRALPKTKVSTIGIDRKQSVVGLGNISQRASSIGQELSQMAASIRKSLSRRNLEDAEISESKRMEYSNGEGKSVQQLSNRLSFAKKSTLPSPRKQSNIFTKEELRSIRLAAAESRRAAEEMNRLNSDDTSVSAGSVSEDDRKKRGFSVTRRASELHAKLSNLSVQSMSNRSIDLYKENSFRSSFEFANPAMHAEEAHTFGMIFFSGKDSMEFDEDD